MLLAEKPPEIFPKHKGYFSFALSRYIFAALININSCSTYNAHLN